MGIVLDSSVIVAAERGRFDLPSFAADHAGESFFVAAVTAAELLIGVERAAPASRRMKRAAFVEKVLSTVPIIDYDLGIARRHAAIWARLADIGNVIGPYDMIIAASALEYGHLLATLNAKEFGRVSKLELVDLTAYLER